MAGDLHVLGLKYGWYQLCQNQEAWSASCRDGVNKMVSCWKHNTCTANRQSTTITSFFQLINLTVSVDERSNKKET